jgi:hypothetical protein
MEFVSYGWAANLVAEETMVLYRFTTVAFRRRIGHEK